MNVSTGYTVLELLPLEIKEKSQTFNSVPCVFWHFSTCMVKFYTVHCTLFIYGETSDTVSQCFPNSDKGVEHCKCRHVWGYDSKLIPRITMLQERREVFLNLPKGMLVFNCFLKGIYRVLCTPQRPSLPWVS